MSFCSACEPEKDTIGQMLSKHCNLKWQFMFNEVIEILEFQVVGEL